MKINKEEIIIPKPSVKEVNKYLKEWDDNKEYCDKEDLLNKLFLKLCQKNTDINDILLKVTTLNKFYSTGIISIYPVAKHILDDVTDIDSRLKKGDISAVSDIQSVILGGEMKKLYSFASKYCSHHNSKDYPIYDSYVDKVLWFFKCRDKENNKPSFSNFKRKDLKDYAKFKSIILEFRDYYGLTNFTLKQIDQYLWQLGKEYFSK